MQSYLSTAPNAPLTHWYQVRCPIMNPILVQVGDKVHVKLRMVANEKQSYDMMLVISLNGVSQTAEYDLKNPSFRYTGAAVQPAAGLSNESATQQLSQSKDFVCFLNKKLILVYQVDQDGNVLAYGSDPNYVYVDGLDVQMQDTNGYQQGNYPSAPVIMNGQPFTPAAVGTPQSVASPFTGSH